MSIPHFQICFVKPQNSIDPMAFRESLFLLRNSLRQLGYACEIQGNHIDPGKINIVVGYNLMEFGEIHKKSVYIPWQLEHLPGTRWFNENALAICRHAALVWDFSEINIELLKEQGIESRLLRLGYNKSMKTFAPHPEKDCDVVFYGSINERRERLLDELAAAGVSVKRIVGHYGAERDAHVAKARIVLNIHYHETGIQESVRISHLLTNDMFVVSEDASDNAFPGVDLVTAPYDALLDTCLDYLENEEQREKRREQVCRQFREHCRMTDYLEPLAREIVLKVM